MLPSGSPRWRRRKHARPGEIVAAAMAVFAEKGFAAARLDDIAARAGVSKGALYLYFETKEDIFRAVVSEAVAPNIDTLAGVVEAYEGRFADLARTAFSTVARVAEETPLGGVVKMVIGESRNFPELAQVWHDALAARALSLMSGAIARAQARGEVRPGDPRLFAVSLISPLLMGVIWRETFVPIGAQPFDLSALAAQHLETALTGMLAKAPQP
jgi:AcrR family transcriptional regulator